MRKTILILTAMLLIVGSVVPVEAASRLQVVRSAVPKVVETVTKTAGKVGDDISSFFWRNKMAITTGTVLATAATNPEPFIDGAVALANGPPVVIQSNGEYPIVKRSRSIDGGGYTFIGSLLGIARLVGMYKYGGRAKTVAKIVTVILLIGFVLFCCNAVRADCFDTEIAATLNVPPWGWRILWDTLTNVIMVVILLLVPT